jgi:hypothetical protein
MWLSVYAWVCKCWGWGWWEFVCLFFVWFFFFFCRAGGGGGDMDNRNKIIKPTGTLVWDVKMMLLTQPCAHWFSSMGSSILQQQTHPWFSRNRPAPNNTQIPFHITYATLLYQSHQLTHKGQNVPVLHEGVQWINAYCYSTWKKKDETFLATC